MENRGSNATNSNKSFFVINGKTLIFDDFQMMNEHFLIDKCIVCGLLEWKERKCFLLLSWH